LTPRIGQDFVDWKPPTGDDRTLKMADFSIFLHLDHPDLPQNTMAAAQRWAAKIAGLAHATNDDTAIKATDNTVEVVCEGHRKLFTPTP
jgi:dipeptidase E